MTVMMMIRLVVGKIGGCREKNNTNNNEKNNNKNIRTEDIQVFFSKRDIIV